MCRWHALHMVSERRRQITPIHRMEKKQKKKKKKHIDDIFLSNRIGRVESRVFLYFFFYFWGCAVLPMQSNLNLIIITRLFFLLLLLLFIWGLATVCVCARARAIARSFLDRYRSNSLITNTQIQKMQEEKKNETGTNCWHNIITVVCSNCTCVHFVDQIFGYAQLYGWKG